MKGFEIAIVLVIVFFSVILHEIAHGFVALLFGDRTAKDANRLTLNPIPHIDLVGTIIFPALLAFMGVPIFGWAKPVPVDASNLQPRRIGHLCVSLAGVATNFLIAIAAALIFRLAALPPGGIGTEVLLLAVFVNLMLGIFNLMPVPPLDGSQLWMMWMPEKFVYWVQQRMMLWFLLIFLILPRLPIGNLIRAAFFLLTGRAVG